MFLYPLFLIYFLSRGIDDIVLSYMLGVFEDVGSDDGFEVEGFVEMMQAYIPGFEDVSR